MKRILVLGGGYVGLYTCLGLQRRLRSGEAEVTLVSPESYMTYQPFLPEAAAGNIEPRHVVVPLRRTLRKTRVMTGEVTGLDHSHRVATVKTLEGGFISVPYDIVVIGLGSISRVLEIPGLEETGVGFKSVEEAIYLRNQVLSRMDAAESMTDPAERQRALTFVFVGGGYSGVEALAELEDLARYACRYYRNVTRSQMTWVLVEATDGILPEIGAALGEAALKRLRDRDIEVLLSTTLVSATGGRLELSDSRTFSADTLVWTAGVRAEPAVAALGMPVDDKGRIPVDVTLRVEGVDDAWAAGDCAAIPDVTTGKLAPPTAQHALREARLIARNIAAHLHNKPERGFRYTNKGGLVSLGRYKGVAKVMGIPLRGFPAWFMHRTYHVAMIPTLNRKARVLVDWTVALFFKRDVVQLGSLSHPRDAFNDATRG